VTRPETAAGWAQAAAQAIRSLNHATLPGAGGLVWPVDAYTVLGELSLLTTRLPQVFTQLLSFLENEVQDGRVVIVDGEFTGDPPAAALACGHWLDAAITAAAELSRDLDRARHTIVWAAATD
jgi:hypothetical protein